MYVIYETNTGSPKKYYANNPTSTVSGDSTTVILEVVNPTPAYIAIVPQPAGTPTNSDAFVNYGFVGNGSTPSLKVVLQGNTLTSGDIDVQLETFTLVTDLNVTLQLKKIS